MEEVILAALKRGPVNYEDLTGRDDALESLVERMRNAGQLVIALRPQSEWDRETTTPGKSRPTWKVLLP